MTGKFKAFYPWFGDAHFSNWLINLCCLGGVFSLGLVAAAAESVPVRKVIHYYALTSANDFPQRDPQDWRLLASNDGGKTWATLDLRTNQVFQARQQRQLYEVDNTNAFGIYRLQIDRVRKPNSASSVQLGELELMGLKPDDRAPVPVFTDHISAQGDNPPAERLSNLFDGRVETKWLDWATNELTRGSWIQWQYEPPVAILVTNIGALAALRSQAAQGFPVRIEAVVAGRSLEDNNTYLMDATGCTGLGGIAEAETLHTGQKILLTGISEWTGGQPGVRDARFSTLGPAPVLEHIRPEARLKPEENFKWVEAEGEVQFPRMTDHEFSFALQDSALNLRVHWKCPAPLDSLPLHGTRVSVRGICVGAFNDQGQWVAASLWAVGQDALTMIGPPAIDQTAGLPAPAQPAATVRTALTTIEQIRRLTREQIQSHPRVKVHGVITGLLGGFIQDHTAGIEVDFPAEARQKLTKPGDYIEVDGMAGLDAVGSPVILADHVAVLGPGKLPAPQRLSLSQLISGHVDGQWIEVEGVVRTTDGAHLLITCDGGELMASVGTAATEKVKALVDAEVRVRGVGVAAMDDQGRVQGIHLLIPSLEQVDVVSPPSDPARLPVHPIGTLLGLSGPREIFHRVKVIGVVTLSENRKVFLQDDTGSMVAIPKQDVVLDARFGHSRWLYWRTPRSQAALDREVKLLPGDRVEAIGFPGTHRYSPMLTEVTFKKIGVQADPPPVELTDRSIEEGALDSTLVTLEGVLRGQNTIGANDVLSLEWEDRTLQILVPEKDGSPAKFALGTRLRITGVCQIDATPYPELGLGVGAVRILARSAKDLVVLKRPPWWTVRRALTLLAAMTVAIVAALMWIKELRRKVEERSAELSAQIKLREQTEHRQALEQERARIAKDLHDDLGANLTQIVFLSERVEGARTAGQEETRWFNLIPATARRTIQSLDEIVWAVNPQHDSLESLANYLSHFAQEYLTLARVRCVLDVPLVLPSLPLSAEIRHNLLLTTREALQNAVTHAHATEVRLTLKLDEAGAHILIADNGNGFDPDAASPQGNGLQNMRRRMEGIGGHLEITSHAGRGTTVRMFVPQQLLHAHVIGGRDNSSQNHENV